jgi:alanine racemase
MRGLRGPSLHDAAGDDVLMSNMKKTWIEISKSALLHNVRSITDHVKPTKVMAVLKANAYGHDAALVAGVIAKEADWIGVDDIDEAITLRKRGIKQPIMILGYVLRDRLMDCAKYSLSFVAYNLETLAAIKKLTAKNGAFKIHIPIETGTTRQGIAGDELEAFVKAALKIPSVKIQGIHTHFANIEDTTDPSYAMGQLKAYEKALTQLKKLGVVPEVRHTAASAAAILYPQTQFDLIRLGMSLYGHWPSKETKVSAAYRSKTLTLQPALTWKTIVAQVKDVKKGTPVSYGLTERVSRDSKVAVLPVGYWDGLSRTLSSVGSVLIRGQRCKVLGRVCMNMVMVDVTDVAGVKPEDEVVIIGCQGSEEISAEDIAAKAGTIQYEFLTRINPQIERKLVK